MLTLEQDVGCSRSSAMGAGCPDSQREEEHEKVRIHSF